MPKLNEQTLSIDEALAAGAITECEVKRVAVGNHESITPTNNPVSAIAQPGYLPLANELFAALEQSQSGKGKERHANDKPFLEQPIMRIAEMTGPGGTAFQAIKKIQESLGMHGRGDTEAATRELHGAMVYAAATILAMRKDV